jgi:hypothetical protein
MLISVVGRGLRYREEGRGEGEIKDLRG